MTRIHSLHVRKTRQTRQICMMRVIRPPPTGPDAETAASEDDLIRWSHEILRPQVQHLAGATLQHPAHLHHLAAAIDTGEKATLTKSVVQCLLTHREGLSARQPLSNLIANRGLEENIVFGNPTDARSVWSPFLIV